MASKDSAREKIRLYGGPYHGCTVKLSRSASEGRYHFNGKRSTFTFRVRGEIGRYVDGQWKPFENPEIVNPNVVLGEN